MKQKVLLIALTIAVIAASMSICVTAQPPGYSNQPSQDGSQYPSYPSNQQGNYPSYQETYPSGQDTYPSSQEDQTGQESNAEHPSTGPASQQPDYTPSASTGKVAENYGQGQSLTKEQATQLGGETTGTQAGGQYQAFLVTGLELWGLYNNYWTKEPIGIYYNGKINLLVYNDQNQYIWTYEKYPNGKEYWYDWGYLYPGYYNRIFLGDAPGWHEIAVWGDNSGYSNVLYIYVWPPKK
jgi:hypothetical protein